VIIIQVRKKKYHRVCLQRRQKLFICQKCTTCFGLHSRRQVLLYESVKEKLLSCQRVSCDMIFSSLAFLSFVQISCIVIGEIDIFTVNIRLSDLIGKEGGGGGVGWKKRASPLWGSAYWPGETT